MFNCVSGGNNDASDIRWCMEFVCGWGDDDFITTDCIGCYGGLGECMADECSSECAGDWDGDCDWCLDNNCWNDFEVCSGVIYGCDEEEACNFEEGANMDAQNCEYPQDNEDCDGNCLLDVDCNGVCGGSAQYDECGICAGNNSSCLGCDNVPNSGFDFDCNNVCGDPSSDDFAAWDDCGV